MNVTYDLLTSLSERLTDLSMFDPEQIDEERLTSTLTTPDGAVRFLEICRRLIERVRSLEGSQGSK